MMSNTTIKWIVWGIFTLISASLLYATIKGNLDQSILMPGPLSNGHYQLTENCQACHTSPFGGKEVLQQACIDCHGDERKKPQDSHPMSKFKDPRNADLLSKINAASCISCHTEHKAEITHKDGLTLPKDFCIHCHQDIGEDRPSHKDMDFMTCKNSGCHNYHNNRAIYTDYLVKHLDEPSVLKTPLLKQREFGSILEELAEYPHAKYPVRPLTIEDADFPRKQSADPEILKQWEQTAHAKSGVNCTACHSVSDDGNQNQKWVEKPSLTTCQSCHDLEAERFEKGKHGMRLKADLPAMKVEHARLTMDQSSVHKQMNCNSCHQDHSFNVVTASVTACLSCHADQHSQSYQQSKHATLWKNETDNSGQAGSGVSCASCHMPRINVDVNDWVSRIMVDHNQSGNLSPNSKMVRQVCMNCHGLDFSLRAMSSQELIENNFSTAPPDGEHPSSVLARSDNERYLRETGGETE